jgi:hypothetical protein
MNTADLAHALATATRSDSDTTSTEGPPSGAPVPTPRPDQNPEGPSRARPSSSALCAAMRRLTPYATKVFMTLVDGLKAGEARKLDHAPGAFMAVSVDCISVVRQSGAAGEVPGGAVFAIAHRYEMNGDLVPDPDVEFYVTDDSDDPSGRAVYPTAIDHGPMGYHRHVELDAAGHPARIARRGQADLAKFCEGWMRNIARQQRLWDRAG